VRLEEEAIVLGGIMSIFVQEKLPNVRLTLHRRWHCVRTSQCSEDVMALLSTVIGRHIHGLCHFGMSWGRVVAEAAPLSERLIPFTGLHKAIICNNFLKKMLWTDIKSIRLFSL